MKSHKNNFNLIRLLAAIQVLVIHACDHLGIKGALVTAVRVVPGVPTFFFVSGLLIYESYRRTSRQGSRSFFVNRVLRIFPALWVCVAVSCLAVWATGYLQTQKFSIVDFTAWLLAQSTFFQFYNPPYMRNFGVGVLNGALWTIAVELQFYALTPVLVRFLDRKILLFAAVLVASLLVNVLILHYLDWNKLWMKLVYTSSATWVYMFMVGCLTAHFKDQVGLILMRLRWWWLVAAYVLTMNLVGQYATNANNGINPLSFFLMAACLLKLSEADWPLPQSVVSFVRSEDFSYGVYLYHMPVLNMIIFSGIFPSFFGFGTALVASLFLAILSWYLIEKPVLRRKM